MVQTHPYAQKNFEKKNGKNVLKWKRGNFQQNSVYDVTKVDYASTQHFWRTRVGKGRAQWIWP